MSMVRTVATITKVATTATAFVGEINCVWALDKALKDAYISKRGYAAAGQVVVIGALTLAFGSWWLVDRVVDGIELGIERSNEKTEDK